MHGLIYAWRGGSGSTTLAEGLKAVTTQNDRLEKQQARLDERLHALDAIPAMRVDLEFLKKNHSKFPELQGDVRALQAEVKNLNERLGSIRSMRSPWRSKPEDEE